MTKIVGGWKEVGEKEFLLIGEILYIAQGSETIADVLNNSLKAVDHATVAGKFIRENDKLFVASYAVPELRIVQNSPVPVVEIVRRFAPKGVEVQEVAQI